MAFINNFADFLTEALNPARTATARKMKYLVNYNSGSGERQPETYAIRITFEEGLLLTEHQYVQRFRKSQNRYYFHPEESHPAVEAHYHIIGPRGKEEIYSVSMSGKAHHKVNRGYQIPRKEADELRALGVNIAADNIIESIENAPPEVQLLTEAMLAYTTEPCAELLVVIERE